MKHTAHASTRSDMRTLRHGIGLLIQACGVLVLFQHLW